MRRFRSVCFCSRSTVVQWGFLAAIAKLTLATTAALAEEKSLPQVTQNASQDRAAATVAPLVAPPASGVRREKQITTVYDVDKLLAKLREDGFDDASARGIVETWAADAVGPANAGTPRPPYGLRAILWHDGRLVVQTSEAGHRQVRETFETLQKYGPAEIALDVRFITLDEEVLKAMLADPTTALTSMPEPSAVNSLSLQGCEGDRPLAHHEGTQVAPAKCMVEQDTPLRYRVMENEEGRKWLDRRQDDSRSNILQAPRAIVLNGQTANVTDTSQTPFVVGMKEITGAQTAHRRAVTARAPQIRVVSEGTTLQLRPLADRTGTIHVDFAATFSKIRKVETVTIGGEVSGKVSLQVPEVATLRLEGGAALKSGQWFILVGAKAEENASGEPEPATVWERLLGGGTRSQAHRPQQLVLMLRAEKLPQPAAKVASTREP